jgi:prefoldin subunit 5
MQNQKISQLKDDLNEIKKQIESINSNSSIIKLKMEKYKNMDQ